MHLCLLEQSADPKTFTQLKKKFKTKNKVVSKTLKIEWKISFRCFETEVDTHHADK